MEMDHRVIASITSAVSLFFYFVVFDRLCFKYVLYRYIQHEASHIIVSGRNRSEAVICLMKFRNLPPGNSFYNILTKLKNYKGIVQGFKEFVLKL